MDIRIKDGDIVLLPTGDYERITGIDEAVQRVCMETATRRGAFIYDRGFGTDYTALAADDELLRDKLDMLIKAACVGFADTEAEVQDYDPATKVVTIKITYKDEERTTEVDLSGSI